MTGSIRLFVAADLVAGATVGGTAAQAHYLARVMRRAAGAEVALFNGRDGEWRAQFQPLGREPARFTVIDRLRPQQPSPDLWLLLPPLRRDATEWAVQKATELGAAKVQLILTERTHPGRPSLERLSAIATEAAEQCERLDLPRLMPARALTDVLAGWPDERPLVVAAERGAAAPIAPASGPAALLVGPEGGLGPADLDVLGRAPFVKRASLGPRILRAETAAIAGLVLLQARATV